VGDREVRVRSLDLDDHELEFEGEVLGFIVFDLGGAMGAGM